MASHEVEIDVPASPEAVWAVVGDFGAVETYLPDIESFRRDGDLRVIGDGGVEITERLLEVDEAGRTIRYGIVDGLPIERHEATISVHPAGDGARVQWRFEVAPEMAAGPMGTVYARALEALRRHFA